MRANRTDHNQTEIIDYCESKGFAVLNISSLKNCCDIIISKDGYTICVEIKDGKKPPSARKITDGEEAFRQRWKGAWRLVKCTADVDNLMLSMKERK